MSLTRRVASVLIVVALLATPVALVAGGKPGSPPLVDTGVIYYSMGGSLYSMKTNGTGKTSLPASGVPSQGLHGSGDERWYVDIRPMDTGEAYPRFWGVGPDATPRHELFLENETGTICVQLTDAADLEPANLGVTAWTAAPTWAADGSVVDAKVSYVARRWGTDADGNDIVTEKGIFVADVDGLVWSCFWRP